ncbi:MAG: TonB-dependent receptor [Methylococcales bacterium]|nr:TonB-dependent receptor [Methylococcales bacterium]
MRRLTISVVFLVLSGQVTASDLSVDELIDMPIEELLQVEVISAARLGQKASQSPSSLSVLTAKDIRTFGWRTLADSLNGMRGLFTSNDRSYSYLGVRGFMHPNDYNSRVLFMIDGQRMNENIYDGGYIAQEFMLDMALVERIEYIPGSGASIYGANAFSGLINVVTKKGSAVNGAQLAGEVGSFDTYKVRASYGKKLQNGTDILVSASHYDSAGVKNLYFSAFDNPATNNGIAHNMDAERADRLFARIEFEGFTLTGGYVDRFKRVPTAGFGGIFNDASYYARDQQFFGNLKYQTSLSDKTALRVKGAYQGYEYNAEEPFDYNGRVINKDLASGRWWNGEVQLTNTTFEHHRLMLGVEHQYDQRQYARNFDVDPFLVYNNTNFSGHRVELYAQDDIQLLDDLIFSAGLRLDYHHMLRHLQLNPRLGLIWSPLDNTRFKLLYSSSFRAPNVWEQGYSIGTSTISNHEEHIKSYEGIVEWDVASGLKLMGNVFYNDMSQILERNNAASSEVEGAFLNSGHYYALGAELETEKRWSNGRLLKASYTYSRLTNEIDGGWANASPQNLFKVHYAEPLFDNFATVGVENIYIGDRKALQGGLANAYNLVNLNLSSDHISRGLDISFGVYNLFDTHYQLLGGTGTADIAQNILPMNGRELRLKIQITY